MAAVAQHRNTAGTTGRPKREEGPSNLKGTSRLFTSPKDLPSTGGFANNHVMVNNARLQMGLPPLARSLELDAYARDHARKMAEEGKVVHSVSTLEELGERLRSKVAGENVQRGPTIHKMHKAALSTDSIWGNVCDARFTEFGMATSKGKDEKLYMCQLFR